MPSGVRVVLLADVVVQPTVRRSLAALFAAAALVVALACANVANLFLVRAAVRSRRLRLHLRLAQGRSWWGASS